MGQVASKLCSCNEAYTEISTSGLNPNKPRKAKKEKFNRRRFKKQENTIQERVTDLEVLEELEFVSHVDIKGFKKDRLENKKPPERSFEKYRKRRIKGRKVYRRHNSDIVNLKRAGFDILDLARDWKHRKPSRDHFEVGKAEEGSVVHQESRLIALELDNILDHLEKQPNQTGGENRCFEVDFAKIAKKENLRLFEQKQKDQESLKREPKHDRKKGGVKRKKKRYKKVRHKTKSTKDKTTEDSSVDFGKAPNFERRSPSVEMFDIGDQEDERELQRREREQKEKEAKKERKKRRKNSSKENKKDRKRNEESGYDNSNSMNFIQVPSLSRTKLLAKSSPNKSSRPNELEEEENDKILPLVEKLQKKGNGFKSIKSKLRSQSGLKAHSERNLKTGNSTNNSKRQKYQNQGKSVSYSRSKEQENIDNASSYATCQGFDNMTLGSLLSSRMSSGAPSKLPFSKRDLFAEFVSEMEDITTYFNFEEPFAMEEVLIDEKSADHTVFGDYINSVMVTFCPEIRDDIYTSYGVYFKKRIIKSRSLLLLKADFSIIKVLLNKKVSLGEQFQRMCKMRLKDKGDFEDESDALLLYNYEIEGKTVDKHKGDLRTVRIGSEKVFPNKKHVLYVYERSQNVNQFYSMGKKELTLRAVKGDGALGKEAAYLIKMIVKFEKVSPLYTKAYIYQEMFWPEDIGLRALRRLTINQHTLSFIL